MNKKVNGDFYILLDNIIKELEGIREDIKTQIKNNATIEYPNKYGTIQVNDKTRKDYTKEEKAILEAYAQANGFTKQVTTQYKEVKTTATTTAMNKATRYANEIYTSLQDTAPKAISQAVASHLNSHI